MAVFSDIYWLTLAIETAGARNDSFDPAGARSIVIGHDHNDLELVGKVGKEDSYGR